MPAEPIDVLSVRIAADVGDFVKDTEAAIKDAEKNLEELAQVAKETGITGSFEDIAEAAELVAEKLGIDVSKALKSMSMASDSAGVSIQQLSRQIIKNQKTIQQEFPKGTKEIEKQKGAVGRLSKVFGGLAKRLLVGLGIYRVAQKIFNKVNSIIKESAKLYAESADKTSIFAQRMGELSQEITTAKLVLGGMVAPIEIIKKKIELLVTKTLVVFVDALTKLILGKLPEFWGNLAAGFTKLQLHIQNIITGIKIINALFPKVTEKPGVPGAYPRFAGPGAKEAADPEELAKLRGEILSKEDIQRAADEARDAATTGADAFVDEWMQILQEASLPLEKMIANQMRAMADRMEEETAKGFARIAERFNKKIDDIRKRFDRRRVDAERGYFRDLEDIDRDAAKDRINLIQDNQLKEMRLREDFKNRLLDLENNYILDLEDAVRERDARQVLSLQRRFNLEKSQLDRDEKLRLHRMKQDFDFELQEIERQRLIRRAERWIAFEEKMEDLAIQEERANADALLWRSRAESDLREANNRKLQIMAQGFIDQFNLTKDNMELLYKYLEGYMGPGGAIESLYKYVAALMGSQPFTPTATPYMGSREPRPLTRFQRGGSFIATSPQMISIAEGAPEQVDITPLSQATGRPRAGFPGGGAGGGSQHTVDVNLSDGLEAHIVDQAISDVADVVIKINQGAR